MSDPTLPFRGEQTSLNDLITLVPIPPGGITSRPILNTGQCKQVLFALDKDAGMDTHTAARPAVVQVLQGSLRFGIDGLNHTLKPGSWLAMPAGAEHDLTALEPTHFLLTLA